MDKVSILLPLYHPNPEYLEKQLISLNDQDYPEAELIVWNDCPEEEIDYALFERCFTHFPIKYHDEKKNLGYVKAFEQLSKLATGEYISYCDQDDIWEKDKISSCIEEIKKNNAVAAVCDRALIGPDDQIVCDSVRKNSHEKRMTWKTGDDITVRAAFCSYCTGMTLVAPKKLVQQFLPLDPDLPHDQQLIFYLSACGVVVNIERPLVRHRMHDKNSSGTLAGVSCKKDYYKTRCMPVERILDRYKELFPEDTRFNDMKACCAARMKGNVWGLLKYRKMIPDHYIYEIILVICPDWLFRLIKKI